MRHSLTASFVARATAEAGKDRAIYWDEALPGFGLMVAANGTRASVVRSRPGPVSRRLPLRGVWPVDQARRQARATLGAVAKGHDPLGERRAEQASVAIHFRP